MFTRTTITTKSRVCRSIKPKIVRSRRQQKQWKFVNPHVASYTTNVPPPSSPGDISKLTKVSIVMEKAQNLAEKLKNGAAYLNEEAFRQVENQKNSLDIINGDLDRLNTNIKQIISTQHPVLAAIAQYYFNLKGKRIRPVVILLLARALWHHARAINANSADAPVVSSDQSRLAEILEMIHTASLIHDDVIDIADSRRNTPSVNVAFGNKVSILAGDFLLARASIALAQMKSFEVTELMSRVISDLVEGEFMQMKAVKKSALDFEYYIQKTYYKTASLIANGCRACAVLSQLPAEIIENSTEFGKHFGLAFQLVDDLLDYVSTTDQLGKPSGQDLKLGLATAPCLYAAAEFPELIPLIERNFSDEGDSQMAFQLVHKSKGIQKTKELAQYHINIAIQALSSLHNSPEKQALIDLTHTVLTRSK